MSQVIQNVNTAFVQNQILNANSQISKWPVILLFGHNQCSACPLAKDTLQRLALNYAGRIVVYYVDTMQNQQVANQFGIRAVPTAILFKNGQALEQIVGVADYYRYNRMIGSYI